MSELFPMGRRYAPDARDRSFRMGPHVEALTSKFPQVAAEGARHYWASTVLDQGPTGTCVAHGWTATVEAAPVKQPRPMSPFDLYRRIVTRDEFRDNDAEAGLPDAALQLGTSVRAGAQTLRALGYFASFLWAFHAEELRGWHLAGLGVAVLGVNWTTAMFEPDSEGFVRYTGALEGGHCVKTTGYNDHVRHNGRLVRAFRIQNSWGPGWGDKGRAWVTFEDMEKLIADDGEACAPSEVRAK